MAGRSVVDTLDSVIRFNSGATAMPMPPFRKLRALGTGVSGGPVLFHLQPPSIGARPDPRGVVLGRVLDGVLGGG